MDGTFKIAPSICSQLYTLHGVFMGECFPFVFMLAQDRTEVTYQRMLQLLKQSAANRNLQFSPRMVLLDFEIAAINAVLSELPNAQVKGCFFHFTQCIWRKVQNLGLSERYRVDGTVSKWIRRISALPFVPLESIDDVFMIIMEEAPYIPEATNMHDYVVDTWIGRGTDDDELYRRDIWNHFETGNTRTINSVEGWHYKLNKRSNSRHPSIFNLILILKRIHQEDRYRAIQLLNGKLLGKRSKGRPQNSWTNDFHRWFAY